MFCKEEIGVSDTKNMSSDKWIALLLDSFSITSPEKECNASRANTQINKIASYFKDFSLVSQGVLLPCLM